MNAQTPVMDPISIASLASLPCWVAWQKECRVEGEDPTKIPYVGVDRKAMANASRWLTRQQAEELEPKLPRPFGMGGIGIEFASLDDGRALAGIDLDLCRDAGTGQITDWGLAIVEMIDTYTEVSPSGTGVKLFFTFAAADMPQLREVMGDAKYGKQFKQAGGKHPAAIELHLGNRYFAVTELKIDGMPAEFRHVPTETLIDLITVVGPAFAKKAKTNSSDTADEAPSDLPPHEHGTDDPDLLARINGRCAFNRRLHKRWSGDWSGLRDASGSGRAFALAAALKCDGFSFEDTVAALLLHSQTAEWTRTKGQANGQRELNRLWERIKTEPPPTEALDGFDLTEDGIALAFTKRHQDDLRYDHDRGAWYQWTGKTWREDETKLAFSWSRRICRQLAKDAGVEGKMLATLAKASTAAAVERFAQADPVLAVTSKIWDRDLFLLGTPDGTVDLRTGEIRAPVPEDHITKMTAVAPSTMPECPKWLAFLEQVTANDAGLIRFLKQWCGYCLTGDISEHALLFAHGPGGNGKGVFLNTVTFILGDYARTAAMDTFVATASDKHPTDLAMLRGARLVCASETEEGRAWAESRIKQMTGGDMITARFMRQDFFEYKPQFKLTIIGNHKPVLKNVDDAARRRFNMAPFLYKPPVKDMQLEEKLRAEAPGILKWMIEGCLDWQKNGLVRPDVVTKATAEYFAEQDLVNQWAEDCCNRGPTQSDTLAVLFKSWSDYALANGEKPGTTKWFSQTLAKLGCEAVKNTPGNNGKRGFKGIGVKLIKQNDRTEQRQHDDMPHEMPEWK